MEPVKNGPKLCKTGAARHFQSTVSQDVYLFVIKKKKAFTHIYEQEEAAVLCCFLYCENNPM